MCLNQNQIEIVENYVRKAGLTYSHLEDDLVDHICCDIETRMKEGKSFHSAYNEIKEEAGQDDLNEIQRATLFLIDKNYRIMKQSMKTLGIIALVMMALATVSKLMHWPGAGILLVISFVLTSLVFYPAVLYTLYKEYFNRTKVMVPVLAFIGGVGFMLGILFKLQHWPGAGIMITAGELLLAILLVITGISSLSPSKGRQLATNLLGTISALGLSLGLLFKIQHWPGAAILLMVSLILFFALFIPLYTYRRFGKSEYVDNRFTFIIFAVGMIAILVTMISLKTSEDVLKDYEAAFITTQQTNQRFEKMEGEKKLSKETMEQSAYVLGLTRGIQNDLIKKSHPNAAIHKTGIIKKETIQNRVAQNVVNSYFSKSKPENKGFELYDALKKLNRFSKHPDFSLEYNQGIMSIKEENARLWLDKHFKDTPLIAVLTELEQIELALNIAIKY